MYNTENYTQYFVITCKGKEPEKKKNVFIMETPCCACETKTTL